MRLTRIDTNKGNPIDGGFLHTVFEKSVVNGRVSIEQIASQKFSSILCEEEWIKDYTLDPKSFIEGISKPELSEETK